MWGGLVVCEWGYLHSKFCRQTYPSPRGKHFNNAPVDRTDPVEEDNPAKVWPPRQAYPSGQARSALSPFYVDYQERRVFFFVFGVIFRHSRTADANQAFLKGGKFPPFNQMSRHFQYILSPPTQTRLVDDALCVFQSIFYERSSDFSGAALS